MSDLPLPRPENSSYDEHERELAYHRMILRGLADADQGRTVSHEEVKRLVASWSQRSKGEGARG